MILSLTFSNWLNCYMFYVRGRVCHEHVQLLCHRWNTELQHKLSWAKLRLFTFSRTTWWTNTDIHKPDLDPNSWPEELHQYRLHAGVCLRQLWKRSSKSLKRFVLCSLPNRHFFQFIEETEIHPDCMSQKHNYIQKTWHWMSALSSGHKGNRRSVVWFCSDLSQ